MNFSFYAILIICTSLLFSSIIPISFAEEYTPEWKLVFISDQSQCSPSKKTIMHEMTSLTVQYFKEYEFENEHLGSACMTFEEYSTISISDDLSVIILILDGSVADSILTKNEYHSVYSHLGDDRSVKHTIIVRINSINDLYTTVPTTWSLSHQLSHYILSYKGYNGNAIEQLLHDEKISYMECIGKSMSNIQCSNIKSILRVDDLGKDFFVIPVYEPVVGKTMVKYLPQELLSSKITIELQREITKWWVNGIIDDSSYTKTILHIINSPIVLNSTENDQVMLLPNGFSILDKSPQSKTMWTSGPFEAFASTGDVSEIFSLIPFEADELNHEVGEFPKWFKIRAQLWSEEKIPDKIFFDGVEALLRVGLIQQ